jgi:hypothetical protein
MLFMIWKYGVAIAAIVMVVHSIEIAAKAARDAVFGTAPRADVPSKSDR